MWLTLLTVVMLLGSGVLAGGMLEVALAEVPALRTLPDETYIQVHSRLDHQMDRYMPQTAVATVAAGLMVILLRHAAWARGLTAAGVLFTLLVGIISERGNVPLNRRIRSWRAEEPPAELAAVRSRWVRSHWLRTAAGFAALVSFAAALAAAG